MNQLREELKDLRLSARAPRLSEELGAKVGNFLDAEAVIRVGNAIAASRRSADPNRPHRSGVSKGR